MFLRGNASIRLLSNLPKSIILRVTPRHWTLGTLGLSQSHTFVTKRLNFFPPVQPDDTQKTSPTLFSSWRENHRIRPAHHPSGARLIDSCQKWNIFPHVAYPPPDVPALGICISCPWFHATALQLCIPWIASPSLGTSRTCTTTSPEPSRATGMLWIRRFHYLPPLIVLIEI